jgi:hypothetical protein
MNPQAVLGFAAIISIVVGLFSSRLWMAVTGGLTVGLCQAALVRAMWPDLPAPVGIRPEDAFMVSAGLNALICSILALSAHTFRRGIATLFRRRHRPSAQDDQPFLTPPRVVDPLRKDLMKNAPESVIDNAQGDPKR